MFSQTTQQGDKKIEKATHSSPPCTPLNTEAVNLVQFVLSSQAYINSQKDITRSNLVNLSKKNSRVSIAYKYGKELSSTAKRQ